MQWQCGREAVTLVLDENDGSPDLAVAEMVTRRQTRWIRGWGVINYWRAREGKILRSMPKFLTRCLKVSRDDHLFVRLFHVNL